MDLAIDDEIRKLLVHDRSGSSVPKPMTSSVLEIAMPRQKFLFLALNFFQSYSAMFRLHAMRELASLRPFLFSDSIQAKKLPSLLVFLRYRAQIYARS